MNTKHQQFHIRGQMDHVYHGLAFALSLILTLGFFTYGYAQPKANEVKSDPGIYQVSLFEHLQRDEPLEVTIQADWEQLEAEEDPAYQKASFVIDGGRHGEDRSWTISLKPRGKYRRRVCDFPPLKLKFSRKSLEAMGLGSEHNKLKLVTHCLDDRVESKENVLREYLAYELYQLVSPEALRVQLLRITYRNAKGRKVAKRLGFVIEDIDEMADRVGAVELNIINPDPDRLIMDREARMAMFQYMIGNEDWSLTHMRNLKLLQDKTSGMMFPVPYDFDFSGLVNPAYARPRLEIGELTIAQRTYLGVHLCDEALRRAVIDFLEAERRLMDHVAQFDMLSEVSRQDIANYLESFFSEIKRTRHHPETQIIRQLQTPTQVPADSMGTSRRTAPVKAVSYEQLYCK